MVIHDAACVWFPLQGASISFKPSVCGRGFYLRVGSIGGWPVFEEICYSALHCVNYLRVNIISLHWIEFTSIVRGQLIMECDIYLRRYDTLFIHNQESLVIFSVQTSCSPLALYSGVHVGEERTPGTL